MEIIHFSFNTFNICFSLATGVIFMFVLRLEAAPIENQFFCGGIYFSFHHLELNI